MRWSEACFNVGVYSCSSHPQPGFCNTHGLSVLCLHLDLPRGIFSSPLFDPSMKSVVQFPYSCEFSSSFFCCWVLVSIPSEQKRCFFFFLNNISFSEFTRPLGIVHLLAYLSFVFPTRAGRCQFLFIVLSSVCRTGPGKQSLINICQMRKWMTC